MACLSPFGLSVLFLYIRIRFSICYYQDVLFVTSIKRMSYLLPEGSGVLFVTIKIKCSV